MKGERDRVAQMPEYAKAATEPKDIEATTQAIIDRLWRLDNELKNALPARLRELLHSLEYDSDDRLLAFADGGYELAAAQDVPEPATLVLVVIGLASLRRRRCVRIIS